MNIRHVVRTQSVKSGNIFANKDNVIKMFGLQYVSDNSRIGGNLEVDRRSEFKGNVLINGELSTKELIPGFYHDGYYNIGSYWLHYKTLFINSIAHTIRENNGHGDYLVDVCNGTHLKKVLEWNRMKNHWIVKASKIINPEHESNDAILLGSGNVGRRPQIIDLTN